MFEVSQAESSRSHERGAAVRGSKHSSARGSTGSVKAAGDDSVGDLARVWPLGIDRRRQANGCLVA